MKKLLLFLAMGTISGISIADYAPSASGFTQTSNDHSAQRRIKVYQRTSAVLNTLSTGYRRTKSLNISVGDITRNQVQTTISFLANGDVYKTVSLRQGDVIKFRVRDVYYKVKLVYLLNKPIGHDYAIFSVERSSL